MRTAFLAQGTDDPVLLGQTVAYARDLIAGGEQPAAMLGYSLGQLAALVVADAIDLEPATRIVTLLRERLLGKGRRALFLGVERFTVHRLCERAREHGIIEVAAHHEPGQTVVAGEIGAVDHAVALGKAEFLEATPLNGLPLHCGLVEPMLGEVRAIVATMAIDAPRILVVDGSTARPLGDADAVRHSLLAGLVAPVLFEESLRRLFGPMQIGRVLECGPGNTMLRMARRIDAAA